MNYSVMNHGMTYTILMIPNVVWDFILDEVYKRLAVMCPLNKLKVSSNTSFWLNHH